jgi:hypothetical protein
MNTKEERGAELKRTSQAVEFCHKNRDFLANLLGNYPALATEKIVRHFDEVYQDLSESRQIDTFIQALEKSEYNISFLKNFMSKNPEVTTMLFAQKDELQKEIDNKTSHRPGM